MSIYEAVFLSMVIAFLVYLSIRGIDRSRERARNNWRLVGQGELSNVITKRANLVFREGAIVRKTRFSMMVFSTIFFDDNTTVIVKDIQRLPPKGTHIKVYKNGIAEFKVEISKDKLKET